MTAADLTREVSLKKRGYTVVAILSFLLLCSVTREAKAQSEITVRLLPGGDQEQLMETLQLLATVAEEEVYVADRDVTLAEVVRERVWHGNGRAAPAV